MNSYSFCKAMVPIYFLHVCLVHACVRKPGGAGRPFTTQHELLATPVLLVKGQHYVWVQVGGGLEVHILGDLINFHGMRWPLLHFQ